MLSKDHWDPTTINQFNGPALAFPKGDSLLTINSEGDLSAQLSDENMNAYFSAIDKKITDLVDSYNQNMTSLQKTLNTQWNDWKKQADATYIKENEEIMIASMVDWMGYVYADGVKKGVLHVNDSLGDYGNYPNSGINTPATGLGFQIKKKSSIGTGKSSGNGGWSCKKGGLTPCK